MDMDKNCFRAPYATCALSLAEKIAQIFLRISSTPTRRQAGLTVIAIAIVETILWSIFCTLYIKNLIKLTGVYCKNKNIL